MVRDYELMYIVRPDLDEEALTAAMGGVQTLVEAQGGEVVSTTPWGKRRLAYEIDRLRDGHYVILHVRLDGDRVREVERMLQISDTVFRHLLTIRVPDPDAAAEEQDGAVSGGGDGGEGGEDADEAPPAAARATATAADGDEHDDAGVDADEEDE